MTDNKLQYFANAAIYGLENLLSRVDVYSLRFEAAIEILGAGVLMCNDQILWKQFKSVLRAQAYIGRFELIAEQVIFKIITNAKAPSTRKSIIKLDKGISFHKILIKASLFINRIGTE